VAATDDLVEDALVGFLTEVAEAREMLMAATMTLRVVE
jgi:hypothetical protein